MNTLYYGDNLNILRDYMGTRRVISPRVGSPHVSKGAFHATDTVINSDPPTPGPERNAPDTQRGALTNVRATDTEVTGYYRVVGQPEDLEGAKELAEKDKYGFQWWVLPLIGAKAFGSEAGKKEGKKGADGGIDGLIVFTDDTPAKQRKLSFQ